MTPRDEWPDTLIPDDNFLAAIERLTVRRISAGNHKRRAGMRMTK
jgi:hypothetical protein